MSENKNVTPENAVELTDEELPVLSGGLERI